MHYSTDTSISLPASTSPTDSSASIPVDAAIEQINSDAITAHIADRRARLGPVECPWCGDHCTGEVRARHDRLDAGSEVGQWKRWQAADEDVSWQRRPVIA